MDFEIEISVILYVGSHVSKLIFDTCLKNMTLGIEMSIFDIGIIKNYMI